ncbi:MAG: VWA domain-containing protein [archaeon]|nr:VWA domain-containing protein [archaeon]
MFSGLFYLLRERRVPVSITEYLTLMEALDKQLINSPTALYYVARSLLVKDEKYFDIYDKIFVHLFKGAELLPEINEDILNWLNNPGDLLLEGLDPKLIEEMQKRFDLDELRKKLEELLKKQKEQHDGGNQWIGTGGTSPLGWGGQHPGGMRIAGYGGLRQASKIAEKRHFRNYRSDVIIDTRSFKVALKKLRKLTRSGQEELDLDETIDKTSKNCGDIDFIFRKERKNNIKLLLLMDVGGSMDPFAELVSRLFSAANGASHFRDFKYYYFHNAIYERLYKDIEMESYELTADVIKKYDSEYRVIYVGDAAMAPSELSHIWGAITFGEETYTPAIVWFQKLKEKFKKSVWLNPEIVSGWKPYTRKLIEDVFPMFDLSIDGIEEAIEILIK